MKSAFTNQRYALILILALAIAPYFIKLGASSLWDANEAFYAETPREMMETGDFLNPSFNYQPRFNKPPLSYWLVAAFYQGFGVSESAERLALACGAMLLMATAFFLGRAAYSTEAGLLAAIALASTPRFMMFSRRIIIDVYIAMFMGLALLFFLLAEKYANQRKLFLVLMYLAAGLGVMTKGPVALALPALAFVIYLAATRQLKKLRQMMLPTGALIVAAIVLPWYGAIYSQHGWRYIETFLLEDNLSRYTQPVWGPQRSVFFYLQVIAGDLFPWSLFLFFAMIAAFVPTVKKIVPRLQHKKSPGLNAAHQNIAAVRPEPPSPLTPDAASNLITTSPIVNQASPDLREDSPTAQSRFPANRSTLLLWLWIAVIVIFYSLSRSKEDLYISPIYTAAAAIIGIQLERFALAKNSPQTKLRWPTFALGVLIGGVGVAVVALFGHFAPLYQLAGANLIGALAISGGLAVMVATWKKKYGAACLAIAIVFIAVNYVFVCRTLPDFERFKPVRALCDIIKREADADARIGYYRVASPSMVFYLRRQIFECDAPEDLLAALATGRNFYCLMNSKDYEALKSSLPGKTRILASRPVFQVKLKRILDRSELPQVVLITNKLTE
ncbi:MAG: glycosyltransferase family 39 protein [Acidobacteria bacterium]|nr:glycosyltransferase family 39 protein [Acidobacteriota bacterium]